MSDQGPTPGRKRVNSILFMIGATLANVVVMIVLLLLFMVLHGRFLVPLLPDGANQVALVLIMFLAVGGTYFLYHLFIKWISKRVDLDKHFDPIFRIGRKRQ